MELPYSQNISPCGHGHGSNDRGQVACLHQTRLNWLAKFRISHLPTEIQHLIIEQVFLFRDGKVGFGLRWKKNSHWMPDRQSITAKSFTCDSRQLLHVSKEWHSRGKIVIAKCKLLSANRRVFGNAAIYSHANRSEYIAGNQFKTLKSDNAHLIRRVDLDLKVLNATRMRELTLCNGLTTLNIISQEHNLVFDKASFESLFHQYADPAFLTCRQFEATNLLRERKYFMRRLNAGKLAATTKIQYCQWNLFEFRLTSLLSEYTHIQPVFSVLFQPEGQQCSCRLDQLTSTRLYHGGRPAVWEGALKLQIDKDGNSQWVATKTMVY